MTDHLPECPVDFRQVFSDCICDRLRACEQRRDRENAPAVAAMCNDEYASGYSDALDAAEAAVQKATQNERWCCGCYEDIEIVLAAIRALKEKP